MTGALASAASVSQNPITVTTDPGVTTFGQTTLFVFPKNNAVVVGGSGNYTFAWSIIGDGGGTWSFTGQGTATVAPVVNSVPTGTTTYATLTCTATDTRTLQTDTSPGVAYAYNNIGHFGNL